MTYRKRRTRDDGRGRRLRQAPDATGGTPRRRRRPRPAAPRSADRGGHEPGGKRVMSSGRARHSKRPRSANQFRHPDPAEAGQVQRRIAPACCASGRAQVGGRRDGAPDGDRQQQGERRQHREDVARLLADRGREEQERRQRPAPDADVDARDGLPLLRSSRRAAPRPSAKKGDQGSMPPSDDRHVEVDRPVRVERRRREALEIVADEEPAQVGVPCVGRHRDVPGRGDGHEHQRPRGRGPSRWRRRHAALEHERPDEHQGRDRRARGDPS